MIVFNFTVKPPVGVFIIHVFINNNCPMFLHGRNSLCHRVFSSFCLTLCVKVLSYLKTEGAVLRQRWAAQPPVTSNSLLFAAEYKDMFQVTVLHTSVWPLDGTVTEPDMSACFCPDHKAPMVLFLDRVYGIEDQAFLLQMLEVGFLPDLRASASLDTVSLWVFHRVCL